MIKEQKATIQKQIQELEMRLNLLTDDGIKNRVLPEVGPKNRALQMKSFNGHHQFIEK